jgi:hypothetical protein
MKKHPVFTLIVVLMLSVCIFPTHAEKVQPPEPVSLFDFGLKAAVSLPSFFWLEDLSWNGATLTAIMPAAWAFAAINVTEVLSVQLEVGYEGKGANISASDGNLLWLFNYFEIPVLAKYSVSTSPSSSIWVAGGGYFAAFLGGVYKFEVPGTEWVGTGSLSTGTLKQVTEIRPYDYGLVLSLGVRNGNILYEFRFPFGLVPALEFTPADTSFGGYREAINSGLLFSIGYQF